MLNSVRNDSSRIYRDKKYWIFEKAKTAVIYASLAVNLALLIILYTPVTPLLYKPLIVNDDIGKSDVIVILSAGVLKSGTLDFASHMRVKKALELYRQDLAKSIISAGGVIVPGIGRTYAHCIKDALIEYGVSESDIFLQDETSDTYHDVNFLVKKYAHRFDFNSAMFVTSSYHTYRVKRILKKIGINAAVVSAEPYEYYPNESANRLLYFRFVVREYLALLYSKYKGWI